MYHLTIAVLHLDWQIAFRDRNSCCVVAVYSHSSKVNHMNIKAAFHNSRQNIIRAADIVIHGIAFVVCGLHGVRSSSLLREMNNGVRAKVF